MELFLVTPLNSLSYGLLLFILSSGLALSFRMVGAPPSAMIDEPTEGVAPKIVEQVAHLFEEIHMRGVSILLVEQERTIAFESGRKEWLEV